jgi:subfamily B ATP-binding cassette protein MsbA
MSSEPPKKDKSISQFRRACGYLYPYRGLVVISIVCALFVSFAFAGGLGTLLPIMRVFLNGDTIQTWVDRAIAQPRLGVTFADSTDELRIVKVEPNGTAAQEGLKVNDVLSIPSAPSGKAGYITTLDVLSDPIAPSARLDVPGRPAITMPLKPIRAYFAIGRGIAGRFPSRPVAAIAAVLGVILGLAVFSNILSFFQEYLSDKSAVMAVNDIRRRLYDHVLHIPMSHFGLKGTSDVTSRLTQDSQALAEGFKTVLGQSIQEPIKAAMAFGIALLSSWKLTMFIVVFTPIMLLIIKKFGKKMRRASKKAMLSSSSMLGQIEGSLLGIRVVKGATAERFERRRYTRIMDGLVKQQLKMSRIDAFTEPTMATLTLVVVAILVIVASYMIFDRHTLDREHFLLVLVCLGGIGDSLRRVSKVNNVLQRSNAAATRIFEVLDLPVEEESKARSHGTKASEQGTKIGTGAIYDPQLEERAEASLGHKTGKLGVKIGTGAVFDPRAVRPIKLPTMQHEIRFEGVTFGYPNTSSPAVIDVSLEVPKGKSIAIVGHNGSGKTTLLALLPRFYDPHEGRITIDGIDLRTVTLKSLRKQISIVTQDSVIFPGTIEDNIRYGNPLATRDEVVAAAKRAFAHEFILEKPQGYDTLLGEMGGQLSGGQKQRLCIARAILRKSPILVLDEATSQVDAHNEDLIQRAIESVMKERTTFVIAHRFSTIRSADEIVVMDRGRIVGQGRHDELLVSCATYRELYQRQIFQMPGDAA